MEQVSKIATVHEVTANTSQQMRAGQMVMQIKKTDQHSGSNRNQYRRPDQGSTGDRRKSCGGCFITHDRKECIFFKSKCFNCGRIGHIRAVCGKAANKNVRESKHTQDECMEVCQINAVLGDTESNKINIVLQINQCPVELQVDTGSPVTLINMVTYRRIGAPHCKKSATELRTFDKKQIPVRGYV